MTTTRFFLTTMSIANKNDKQDVLTEDASLHQQEDDQVIQRADKGSGGPHTAQRIDAALYYYPEAYTVSGPKLMGRHAAGESFLKAFILYSQAQAYWLQVQQQTHAKSFAVLAQQLDKALPINVVDNNSLAALATPGVIYCPGPGLAKHAWQRAAYGHQAWSLCGITHTISSAKAMDDLTDLLTAPVQSWDAIICTSTAVKASVERLLQAQADYLVQRLGVQKLVLPLLPVIPLGIHTQDYVYTDTQKISARRLIEVDDNTLVVLFMGRLSFHAKAHPLAMYQALEIAAGQLATGQQLVLIECGWHANEAIAKAYQEAAQLACPSVRVITLDGRIAENRTTAWASADVFCSLSDNIQESFGIVPIEAMAAGLPVVVSDWDGYKDTVRQGEDGFRIPTIMPSAGLGVDIALRHALELDNYDMYCGHTCSLIAIDVDASAAAFNQLFASSELRRRMGAAGQSRAREVYDWAVIIPLYEDLWMQQAAIRKAHVAGPTHTPPWPARMDPFVTFSHYPSVALTTETKLALVDANHFFASKRLSDYRQLAMVNFAKRVLPTEAECHIILEGLSGQIVSAADLIKPVATERQVLVFRAITWLLKMGIVKVVS